MVKHFSTYLVISVCFLSLLLAQNQANEEVYKEFSQFTHETWTTDDGLPQNSINNIVQTNDGYLWMGTQEGLVRFDGVTFTVFNKKNTPAINNNFITVLYVDRNGILWIGTYNGGLTKYQNGVFTHIDHIPQLSHGHVRAIFQDTKATLWIALREHGVITMKDSTFTVINKTTGLISNDVLCFSQDLQGKVWIGTEVGISIYNNGLINNLTIADGLVNNTVTSLREASNGTMWIGTNDGLMNVLIDFKDKSRFLTFTEKNGLPSRIVYSIFIDKNEAVWVRTKSGVARIDRGIISSLTNKDGQRYGHVMSLFIDSEENIWIGADGRGLEILRKRLFTNYTAKEGLPSNAVHTIMEDYMRNMWIGTDSGLAKMNYKSPQTFVRYSEKEGMRDNEIYSVAEDDSDRIWVATASGLNIIENGKVKPVQPVEKTKGLISSHIFADSKGRMWVTSSGEGIYLFENGTVKQITTAQGLASNYTSCVIEDFRGNIWVGTDGAGISVIGDDGITSYTTENGLTNNFIRSMYVTNDNSIWIGTFGGGLICYTSEKFFTLTSVNGLFDDVIFSILEDDMGRLWMTSNKGIFYVDKFDVMKFFYAGLNSITCAVYGREHGMINMENSGGVQPAGWKVHDGTLWFSTAGGVTIVNPKKVVTNQRSPKVVIEQFLIDNQPISFNKEFIVPAENQRIEIHFTGLSFVSPKKIRFKAMLDGYDKKWYDLDTRRTTNYTHLPPGKYTFRIVAANSDGVWDSTGVAITFVKKGYFYETDLFIVGMILLVLSSMVGVYRARVHQIQRREQKLKHLVETRTKDLQGEQETIKQLLDLTEQEKVKAENANAVKSQLLDMVTHHVKSPLISITGLTKQIEQSGALDSVSKKYLKMIRNSSDGMIKVINNLLNLSGMESGAISFQFEKVNLAEIAGMVIDSYKFLAEKKEQTLTFVVDEFDTVMVMADIARIQDAIENLVSNAIKYSPLHSAIQAGVYRHNDKVQFWITDEGPGISAGERNELFKKFRVLSAKPTGDETATGLGLAIVKETVDAHGGKIYVNSTPPMGSTFTIELNRVE
ncbi:MAG: two-component regulator propeller domain-containing protein [Bacteroidota bacterium]|nr:two-component regulator propeller domain-containing protein [Bacteroidota bacterium]